MLFFAVLSSLLALGFGRSAYDLANIFEKQTDSWYVNNNNSSIFACAFYHAPLLSVKTHFKLLSRELIYGGEEDDGCVLMGGNYVDNLGKYRIKMSVDAALQHLLHRLKRFATRNNKIIWELEIWGTSWLL